MIAKKFKYYFWVLQPFKINLINQLRREVISLTLFLSISFLHGRVLKGKVAFNPLLVVPITMTHQNKLAWKYSRE